MKFSSRDSVTVACLIIAYFLFLFYSRVVWIGSECNKDLYNYIKYLDDT